MSVRPLIIVAGIGNGKGTGGSTARLFAKQGYRVAIIARGADQLNSLATEINQAGGEAAAFPLADYSYSTTLSAFDTILAHKWGSPDKSELRVAVFNAGAGVWKGFLDVTEQDIEKSLQVNITAAFAFSRGAILAFKQNGIDENGSRGTLIFTGATAAIRGNVTTSAFAAGKFGIRALSQSLAKEFGKENIHVAHSIIDGGISTDRSVPLKQEPGQPPKVVADNRLNPDAIAKSYLYLAQQDRSAWTWELDLRPAHEKW